MKEIINYLEHPPETQERLVINGKDFGSKTNFSEDKLEEMISALTEEEKLDLSEKIITVCTEWEVMKVAPNNCIGTIARYQLARNILKLI